MGFNVVFRARKVYVGGLVTYSTGMLMMALTKNKFGVILFSGTAGVMYSTLFTMPYLIIAHYHARGVVSVEQHLITNVKFVKADSCFRKLLFGNLASQHFVPV